MTHEPPQTRPWTARELARLDDAPLLKVAGMRADGSLRSFVVIGHVRVDGDELIRSLNGTEGAWYREALRSGQGAIDVDGRRIAVTFTPDLGREPQVDHALRARYGNDSGVRQMTSSPARDATLRVTPLA